MLRLKSIDLKTEKIDTLIIPVCEDKQIHDNRSIIASIKRAKKLKEFNGKKDDEVILYELAEIKAERVIFLGLGELEKVDLEALRALAGKTVKNCIKKNLSTIWIAVPVAEKVKMETASVLGAMLEGLF